jgi:Response regulator containing a CheY-like receiver domain and an HTH DNA-binding domain
MAQLEGFNVEGRKLFPLDGAAVTVGRSPEAGVRLGGDAAISRLHARLETIDGGWTLSDLGSRNGTFLNGRRLETPMALRPGDEIRIGAWRLDFVDDTADAESTLLENDQRGALPEAPTVELSARETEVLALLAQGDTDEQIATALFIAVATVRSHLDRIRDKTGCRRRPELTRLAVEQGIVPPMRRSRP